MCARQVRHFTSILSLIAEEELKNLVQVVCLLVYAVRVVVQGRAGRERGSSRTRRWSKRPWRSGTLASRIRGDFSVHFISLFHHDAWTPIDRLKSWPQRRLCDAGY